MATYIMKKCRGCGVVLEYEVDGNTHPDTMRAINRKYGWGWQAHRNGLCIDCERDKPRQETQPIPAVRNHASRRGR